MLNQRYRSYKQDRGLNVKHLSVVACIISNSQVRVLYTRLFCHMAGSGIISDVMHKGYGAECIILPIILISNFTSNI